MASSIGPQCPAVVEFLMAEIRAQNSASDKPEMGQIFQQAMSEVKETPLLASSKRRMGKFCHNKMMPRLYGEPIAGEAILFVGATFGLDLTAMRGRNRQIKYMICIDKNPCVDKFWRVMGVIIKQSNSRQEAYKQMSAFIEKDTQLFQPEFKTFWKHYVGYDSRVQGAAWLLSDAQFLAIKAIFDNNCFVYKRIDLTDVEAIKTLANQVAHLKFDSVYLSNVREYVEIEGKLPLFHEAIKALKASITPETLFIDTVPRVYGIAGSNEQSRAVRNVPNTDFNETFPPSPCAPNLLALEPSEHVKLAAYGERELLSIARRQAMEKLPSSSKYKEILNKIEKVLDYAEEDLSLLKTLSTAVLKSNAHLKGC
jgi:hypothetical protein